jgi:hypothetical protein
MFAKRMNANIIEIESSHVPMVSHPDSVTELITEGLKATMKMPA